MHSSLNATKQQLNASKVFNDQKAKKIDKVQKAQTKRWLKMEYGVAVRAAVEEELETVCSRDEITASKDLATACTALVESHEDALPRAIIDGSGWEWCEKEVEGCDELAVKEALRSKQKLKSEKPPKGKAATAAGGVVRRLVGSSYSRFVRVPSMSVLVMLHASPAIATNGYKPSDIRFANAVSQFYSLATLLNSSAAQIAFGQMDMEKNQLPGSIELSDPEGLQFLLHVDGQEAKLLPEVGEASLAFQDGAELKTRLTQFLLSYLKVSAHAATEIRSAAALPEAYPKSEDEADSSLNPLLSPNPTPTLKLIKTKTTKTVRALLAASTLCADKRLRDRKEDDRRGPLLLSSALHDCRAMGASSNDLPELCSPYP
ncbi:MAG: hypothetical protein SGPRY_003088 [Prymnesium sp.]